MTASVLTLDKEKLKWLLNNKDCFSDAEVKVAAKCLVQMNKKPVKVVLPTQKEADIKAQMNAQMNALNNRGLFYFDPKQTSGIW